MTSVMAEPLVVHGLRAKRAELAGKVEHLQGQLRQLVAALEHVDACLVLFSPDSDPTAIKPKPVPPIDVDGRRETVRIILHALRTSEGPQTVEALTKAVMRERGMHTGDRKRVKLMQKRVGAAMRRYRARGLVTRAVVGDRVVWART